MHEPKSSPRVFVSYSWDSAEHCAWVLAFAHTLGDNGVHVTLDQWHLKAGQDKTYFMEESVASSDYVLLICTPTYAEKANQRSAGVGYEAMILTGELADNIRSDRFIPVLRTGDWAASTPRWLRTRIGFDLTSDPCPSDVLEAILRRLYGATPQQPPPGPPPQFAPLPEPRLNLGQPNGVAPTYANGAATSPPLELPPPADHFFGRQPQRVQLVARLRERRNSAVVGDAGFGKTALAAQAIREVTGETLQTLAASPYPDGVLFLDFYTLEGSADRAWDALANRLAGPDAWKGEPAKKRAMQSLRGRRVLIVVEGAEEADGRNGHPTVHELLSVLAPENRYLLLTRVSDQIDPTLIVSLPDTLDPEDAARLFDSLSDGRVTGEARTEALRLLDGHPLALTWAAKRLRYGDDAPEAFVAEWKAARLPGLSDPQDARHTLDWLYNRSVRGLPAEAQQALTAAALLSFAPVPVSAIAAALNTGEAEAREQLRLLTRHALLRSRDGNWQFTHVLGYGFARQEKGSEAALRLGLGRWLHAQLTQSLARGAAPGLLPLHRLMEHLGAFLRADDDQSLWWPLVVDALYDFSDRIVALGRLGQALSVLDSVQVWFAGLPAAQADEPYWQRERSSLLNRRADMLAEQGSLDGALLGYRDSLQILQRLAQADSSNTDWQRDLSVSQDKVSDMLALQGNLDGALIGYRDSLQIRQRLAQADPSNAEWQRNLSVSQEKVADMLARQGNLDAALLGYRDSIQIRERLALADPSNTNWQRDLSFSLTNLALLHEKQGERAEALRYAQQSLSIDERLTALDPTNATWQNDVQVSRALVTRLTGSP